MSKVQNGQNVSVHYVGTLEDGTKFDSSHDRGETLNFQVGSGQMITGFDKAVVGMQVGEKKSITLAPSDAYGDTDPNAVTDIPKSNFDPSFEPVVGHTVVGQNEMGQQMMAKIEAINESSLTLDFNHPLAGKNLSFDIELVGITV